MATIIDFQKQPSYGKGTNSVVDVNCLYERGRLADGRPCVVLKTYNPSSKNKGISQTLHITKETALQLIDILKTELNI